MPKEERTKSLELSVLQDVETSYSRAATAVIL